MVTSKESWCPPIRRHYIQKLHFKLVLLFPSFSVTNYRNRLGLRWNTQLYHTLTRADNMHVTYNSFLVAAHHSSSSLSWCHGVQAQPVDFGSCPSPLGSLSSVTVTIEQAQHTKQCPVCGMSRVWMRDTLSAGQTTWSLSCPIKNKQRLRKSCAPNLAKCSPNIGVFGWVMQCLAWMLHRTTPCKQNEPTKGEKHTHTHTHTKSAQWHEKLGESSMISVCSGAHTPFHVGVVLTRTLPESGWTTILSDWWRDMVTVCSLVSTATSGKLLRDGVDHVHWFSERMVNRYSTELNCLERAHSDWFVELNCLERAHSDWFVELNCLERAHSDWFVEQNCQESAHADRFHNCSVLPSVGGVLQA